MQPLRTTQYVAPEVLLPPGEVVVVVHLVHGLGAEDLEHLPNDDVAARVGVRAGQLHRSDVGLGQLGAQLEEDGRRVHAAFARPPFEGEPLREGEEARGRLVPEAARAEVDADPDAALLVLHQVDVVVAGSYRAELRLGEPGELPLRGELRVADALQHRMVGALPGGDAHAEGDPPRDLRHQPLDAAEHVEVGAGQLGTSGLVAAADVEADAGRRDMALVGDAAADRLRVAGVVVCAEHAELGATGLHAAAELGEASLVDGSERLDLHELSLA